MEFLVEFELNVPEGTPESDVKQRQSAEAAASADLAREGHLVRLWKPPVAPGERQAVGLYRADSEAQLDGLLGALPLSGWMQITVTPLELHPNDPTSTRTSVFHLPDPRLTPVYRLDATLGEPLDLGDIVQGHRRIVPLTGGTFTGPQISGTEISGTLVPRSATSATRCGQMAAICSTSNRVVCATAPPRSSPVWAAVRTSTPASTRSAPPRRSRPPRQSSTG